MLYTLNSAVITGFGNWLIEPVTPENAAILLRGGFVSAIGYAETADALATLTGIAIPTDKKTVDLLPGDQAIVLRPRAGFRFDPSMKGHLSTEYILEHNELGKRSGEV